MIYFMRGLTKPYIMSIDIEYDNNEIIQIGSIVVKNIGENLYQPYKSLNLYVKKDILSKFIQDYTNITKSFLDEYGEDEDNAKRIWREYISEFAYDDLLIISHGIHQDIMLMNECGFNIEGYENWCTYYYSKCVLKREWQLSLSDIIEECGLIPISEHNAYADALSTLNIFSFLLKLEGEEK